MEINNIDSVKDLLSIVSKKNKGEIDLTPGGRDNEIVSLFMRIQSMKKVLLSNKEPIHFDSLPADIRYIIVDVPSKLAAIDEKIGQNILPKDKLFIHTIHQLYDISDEYLMWLILQFVNGPHIIKTTQEREQDLVAVKIYREALDHIVSEFESNKKIRCEAYLLSSFASNVYKEEIGARFVRSLSTCSSGSNIALPNYVPHGVGRFIGKGDYVVLDAKVHVGLDTQYEARCDSVNLFKVVKKEDKNLQLKRINFEISEKNFLREIETFNKNEQQELSLIHKGLRIVLDGLAVKEGNRKFQYYKEMIKAVYVAVQSDINEMYKTMGTFKKIISGRYEFSAKVSLEGRVNVGDDIIFEMITSPSKFRRKTRILITEDGYQVLL